MNPVGWVGAIVLVAAISVASFRVGSAHRDFEATQLRIRTLHECQSMIPPEMKRKFPPGIALGMPEARRE